MNSKPSRMQETGFKMLNIYAQVKDIIVLPVCNSTLKRIPKAAKQH